MSYEFKGKTYPTLADLGRELNMYHETLSVMSRKSNGDIDLFYNLIDEYLEDRKLMEKLSSLIYRKYGKIFSNKVELKKIFKEEKIKVPPLGCTYRAWYEAICYAIEGDYMWLVAKIPNFEYKGIIYPNYSKFVHHYKIITKTLIDEIIINKGDIDKAILNCENDPDFGVVEEVIINGHTYSSAQEASSALGIPANKLKQLRRSGMTYQEAYEEQIKNKEIYKSQLLFDFPITNGEITFKTVEDLSDYLGMAVTTVYPIIRGLSEEEVFKLPKKEQKKFLFDGKEFNNIMEIENYLDIPHTSLNYTASRLGLTSEEFIANSEKYAIYYEGKKCYALQQLANLIDLDSKEIGTIYNEFLTEEDLLERSKQFEAKIKDRLRMNEYLYYGSKSYDSIYHMSRDLNMSFVFLKKNMENKKSKEEFQEWLETYLVNRDKPTKISTDPLD